MTDNRCYGCMNLKTQPVCEHCGWDEKRNNLSHQLPVGTVLRDQYVIGRALGQGGFGITYLGWDQYLDIPVAIKEYYPSGIVSRESSVSTVVCCYDGEIGERFRKSKDRFMRESRTLARFSDMPEVVQVKSFFPENNTAYIVMEYVQGITMKEYVRRAGGRLTMERTLEMLRPVIQTLDKLHREGIVHRDISPDNIMILPNGRMKLIDFGAVRDVSHADVDVPLSRSTEAILKHGFAPIEQYQNRGSLGPWTDVYALCATIYYCVTGHVLMDAPGRLLESPELNLRQVASMTAGQEQALNRGLELMPAKRIRSMAELEQGLYGEPERTLPLDEGKTIPLDDGKTIPLERNESKPFENVVEEVVKPEKPNHTERPKRKKPDGQATKKRLVKVACAAVLLLVAAMLVFFGMTADKEFDYLYDDYHLSRSDSIRFVNVPEGCTPRLDNQNYHHGIVIQVKGPRGLLIAVDEEDYAIEIDCKDVVSGDQAPIRVIDNDGMKKVTATIASVRLPVVIYEGNPGAGTEAANDKSGNVLANPYLREGGIKAESPVFSNGLIMRKEINKITFLDTLTDMPDSAWDASEAQDGSVMAWAVQNGELYDLYIAGEGGVMAPEDSSCLFENFEKAINIDFNDCFDTSGVTNMSYMFLACYQLTELDLSSFDTSSVTNMEVMFVSCQNLTKLDLSSFDISSVTDMSGIFSGCTNLTELDLSSFDTSSVTDMSAIFSGCTNLTELDLSSFDTSSVMYMVSMFEDCTNLTELDLGSFDTSKVASMIWMFRDCEALERLNLSSFTSTSMDEFRSGTDSDDTYRMFYNCGALTELICDDKEIRWQFTYDTGHGETSGKQPVQAESTQPEPDAQSQETPPAETEKEGTGILKLPTFLQQETKPSKKPSVDDVKPFGDVITYPDSGTYLDSYETKYVKAPKGNSIYVFWNYNGGVSDSRRKFNLYEGDEVTVLARQGTRSCVIFKDENGKKQIGWVNSDYLVSEK